MERGNSKSPWRSPSEIMTVSTSNKSVHSFLKSLSKVQETGLTDILAPFSELSPGTSSSRAPEMSSFETSKHASTPFAWIENCEARPLTQQGARAQATARPSRVAGSQSGVARKEQQGQATLQSTLSKLEPTAPKPPSAATSPAPPANAQLPGKPRSSTNTTTCSKRR